MGEFIIYATKSDAGAICKWINDEPDVAWIVKVGEQQNSCHWKAVSAIDKLQEQTYALWHSKSGPLNIPSGDRNIPDAIVANPFEGWHQTMQRGDATSPWFGANLPGPYTFRFSESGREVPGSLARSGFSWAEDRYKAIGKPAHPSAKLWWKRLRLFLERSSFKIPWAIGTNKKRITQAFAFPEARLQIDQGRHRDVNL